MALTSRGCNGTEEQIWFTLDSISHILNFGAQKCLTVSQYYNGAYARVTNDCTADNAQWSFL